MRILLDTHAIIWYANGDNQLSKTARELIDGENEKYISIASIWELAIKVNIGKIEFKSPFRQLMSEQIEINNYQILDLNIEHLFRLSTLELFHRDPFDRIIICQSIIEQIPIITVDEKFQLYPVETIW